MDFPNSKTLKKLADSCRKAGISHFKQGDLEFTLTEVAPVSQYRRAQKSNLSKPESKIEAIDKDFESDELSQEQLMFYSTPDEVDESAVNENN